MITDDHPSPNAPLVTATPSLAEPGQFLPGVQFQSIEPLFTEPDATVFLGPGFLIENFQVVDSHTAVADVRVSPRVLPIDHGLVLDTPNFIRVGTFDLTSCGPLGCLRPNELPVGALEFRSGAIAPGVEFPVALVFDDPDGDFVQAEIAIEEVPSQTIVFNSPLRTFRTHPPFPETLRVIVPGLASGGYVALGILNDGIGGVQVSEVPFVVGPCDIDGNGIIDRNDINAIFAARNTPAAAGDRRDADGDGLITVNDARICALRCRNPRCEPGPVDP